jgi:hypothetical protein
MSQYLDTNVNYQLHRRELMKQAGLTWTERTINSVKSRMAAPQAVSPYAGHYVFPDVSVWQPANKISYGYLRLQGVRGVLVKGLEVEIGRDPATWVDSQMALHAQGAYDANMWWGMYRYGNPQWGIDAQLKGGQAGYEALPRKDDIEYQKTVEGMKNKYAPCLYINDAERWYAKTSQYLEYLHGTRKLADVAVIPPTWILAQINKFFKDMTEGMQAGEIPCRRDSSGNVLTKLAVYTGDWFTKQYMLYTTGNPSTNLFYNNAEKWEKAGYLLWVAKYPWSGVSCLWPDLQSKYLPDGINQKPDWCNFPHGPSIWQEGVFTLPVMGDGSVMALDTNISVMPNDQFDTIFVPPKNEIPPDQTCPEGMHWDVGLNNCVLDEVPDGDLDDRATALEARATISEDRISRLEEWKNIPLKN